jgi:hypothetical protein
MTILFSVPVHESNEIIRDTLANARKYNPGCIFVLHVSGGFKDFDFSIGNDPDVLINPTRFHTIHSRTSHVPLHFTNYKCAVDNNMQFDQVCILHTSEMFIKYGMEDYIKQFEYSLWFNQDNQPRVNIWPPFTISYNNKVFKDLFDPNDIHNYLGNVIEGHWWSRDIFEKMYQWTASHYNIMEMLWPYASEEVFFATLGHHLSDTKHFGTPYNAFHHKTHYVDNIPDVDDIRANKMVTIWNNNNFVYNKIPISSKNLYSIKRISRDLNDPIRKYINGLKD